MTIAMHQPAQAPTARSVPTAAVRAARDDLRRRRLAARYRRRRAVAGLLVGGAVVVGALGATSLLTGPGGGPASAAGTGTAPAGHPMSVRAAAGDSLWSIAEAHRGEIAVGRYLEALIDLNGGTVIQVGQLVRLP